ncbi:MAG: hypothetical protein ACQEQV_00985 [Fibrobacterota bacterium]
MSKFTNVLYDISGTAEDFHRRSIALRKSAACLSDDGPLRAHMDAGKLACIFDGECEHQLILDDKSKTCGLIGALETAYRQFASAEDQYVNDLREIAGISPR